AGAGWVVARRPTPPRSGAVGPRAAAGVAGTVVTATRTAAMHAAHHEHHHHRAGQQHEGEQPRRRRLANEGQPDGQNRRGDHIQSNVFATQHFSSPICRDTDHITTGALTANTVRRQADHVAPDPVRSLVSWLPASPDLLLPSPESPPRIPPSTNITNIMNNRHTTTMNANTQAAL